MIEPFMVKTVIVLSIVVPLIGERLSSRDDAPGSTATAILISTVAAIAFANLIFRNAYPVWEQGAFFGMAVIFYSLAMIPPCPIVSMLSRAFWTLLGKTG